MTRRILAGFLAVLVVVITAIIVPLGLIVTAQRRHDFTDSARAAARSLATLAEEQLDDHDSAAALPGLLATAASPGDRVAVLDRAGTLVATTAHAAWQPGRGRGADRTSRPADGRPHRGNRRRRRGRQCGRHGHPGP